MLGVLHEAVGDLPPGLADALGGVVSARAPGDGLRQLAQPGAQGLHPRVLAGGHEVVLAPVRPLAPVQLLVLPRQENVVPVQHLRGPS